MSFKNDHIIYNLLGLVWAGRVWAQLRRELIEDSDVGVLDLEDVDMVFEVGGMKDLVWNFL